MQKIQTAKQILVKNVIVMTKTMMFAAIIMSVIGVDHDAFKKKGTITMGRYVEPAGVFNCQVKTYKARL